MVEASPARALPGRLPCRYTKSPFSVLLFEIVVLGVLPDLHRNRGGLVASTQVPCIDSLLQAKVQCHHGDSLKARDVINAMCSDVLCKPSCAALDSAEIIACAEVPAVIAQGVRG